MTPAGVLAAGVFGLGPLDPWLDDPDVTDVMVNAGGEVWVDRMGGERCGPQYVGRLGPGVLDTVLERILTPLGRRLDRASPVAVATARSQSLASDDTAVTAAARLALAAPCELSDEDEELRASAASSAPAQPLPWAATAHAAAAALAAEAAAEDAVEPTAPPRRSKKRCSLEAGGLPAMHALLAVHAARQEGEAGCRA